MVHCMRRWICILFVFVIEGGMSMGASVDRGGYTHIYIYVRTSQNTFAYSRSLPSSTPPAPSPGSDGASNGWACNNAAKGDEKSGSRLSLSFSRLWLACCGACRRRSQAASSPRAPCWYAPYICVC